MLRPGTHGRTPLPPGHECAVRRGLRDAFHQVFPHRVREWPDYANARSD